jgi:hypothetical protein
VQIKHPGVLKVLEQLEETSNQVGTRGVRCCAAEGTAGQNSKAATGTHL